MGDDEKGLVGLQEGLDADSSSSSSSSEVDQAGLDLVEGDNVPKDDGSNGASCATDETAADESISDSFGIATYDDDDDDDDGDDSSQSTPIAKSHLSRQKQSAGVGAVAVAGAAPPHYRYTEGPPTKTSKARTNVGRATAVVVASSSNARMVPCDRFVTEDAAEHVNEAPLQHPDNGDEGDDDDDDDEVDANDQRTVSSGSSSGSSWLDAHFARRFERGPTPPRISSSDLAGHRIIEASQDGADDNVPARFDATIPGAYSVVQQGAVRPADDAISADDAIFEMTSSVYRLAEAAVVDDDVIVDARPVNEENESNLTERMAEMERRYSLASLALEDARDREDQDNREKKKRRHRTLFWVALICAFAVIVITTVVVTTFKTTRTTNNLESTREGSSSNASSTASDEDLTSSDMLSLRNIVGGGSSDFDSDPNRLAALDWMSRDQIRISLMRSASGDDASEGEHVWKLRQRYVSALLFWATDGPSWYARLGFLSSMDECDWNRAILGDESVGEVTDFGGALEVKGLFCNEEGHIQRISLWWNGLAGTIPSEVSFLSGSLEGLNIAGGSISGAIPSSFGELKQLKELSVSEHCLSGTLPESISSLNRLEVLNLHGNDNLSGSLNTLCKTNNVSWFAADCGDCPGSEVRIQCDCCVCCESASFSCCDKEGEKLYEWMNLAENPITNLPLSFDRPCLSEESVKWREVECPCVVYGKGGEFCSTECNDDKTLLQEALEQVTDNFP